VNNSNDVDVRVIINDDELICVITRLSIKSERNFSDYITASTASTAATSMTCMAMAT
jgi:hypothetical protein